MYIQLWKLPPHKVSKIYIFFKKFLISQKLRHILHIALQDFQKCSLIVQKPHAPAMNQSLGRWVRAKYLTTELFQCSLLLYYNHGENVLCFFNSKVQQKTRTHLLSTYVLQHANLTINSGCIYFLIWILLSRVSFNILSLLFGYKHCSPY